MKKIISVIMLLMFVLTLTACGNNSKEHDGQAKTPSASSAQKGRNYEDVVKDFEDKGFTNIRTETIDDLVTGWLTKDGEVESVSVDGNKDYSADKWYQKDVTVIITYHVFSKSEENSDTTSPINSTNVKYYNDTSSIVKSTDNETAQERRKIANDIADSQPDVVLNSGNNTNLMELLQLKNPADQKVSEFSLNYYGWTIEFDGNIASVDNYKDFENYYNVLLNSNDYSKTESFGPNFKLENISSKKFPTITKQGQNIHIVAKVGTFDQKSETFSLSLVSITER